MARTRRLQIPGAAYWVSFKGNAGASIFKDDADRIRLSEVVADNAEDFGVRVYAYCWLDQQGHLLLETPLGNLGIFMRNVLTRYGAMLRAKYGVEGHVFQGRFDSIVVGGDAYLLKVSRHIHLLPVSQLMDRQATVEEKKAMLDACRWSSYRQAVGLEGFDRELELDRVGALAPGTGKPGECYRRYVEEALKKGEGGFGENVRRSTLAIGDEAFLERVKQEQRGEGNVSGTGRSAFALSVPYENPERVISEVCKRLKTTRKKMVADHGRGLEKGIVALALVRRCGLSYMAIARLFGASSGLVITYAVRKAKAAAQEDDALKALLDELASVPQLK